MSNAILQNKPALAPTGKKKKAADRAEYFSGADRYRPDL